MINKNNFFVISIGTDSGKTYFIEEFVKKILSNNKTVDIIKPVITGVDVNNLESMRNSDTGRIIKSLNLELNIENFRKISPYIFKIPASPHYSSLKESGEEIDFDELLQFCQNFISHSKNEYNLIESAGGLMTPINFVKCYFDLLNELSRNYKISLILICDNYLGSISHSLSAIKNISELNIEKKYILINNYRDKNKMDSMLDCIFFRKTINSFLESRVKGKFMTYFFEEFFKECNLN